MKSLRLIFMVVAVVFLLVAGTVSATMISITETNIVDYDYIFGSGTIELVNTTNAVGTASDLSLKMVWPASADDSGIQITGLSDPTVSSIIGWSYWINAPTTKNPHLMMYLDTDGIGGWDTLVKDKRYNVIGGTDYGDTWLELDSSGTMSFNIKKTGFGSSNWTGTWADFKTAYGTAVVKEVRICHVGYIPTGYPITTYLDDFSFGDADYVLSRVPEPATIALLGLSSLILMRKKY